MRLQSSRVAQRLYACKLVTRQRCGPRENLSSQKVAKKRAKGEPACPESTKDEQPFGQPA